MRLNKFLSDRGICSRRQADRYIEEGRVSVNGMRAGLGLDIDPEKDTVKLDDDIISQRPERVILAYNKPEGIVSSTVSQGREKNDIISAIGYDIRLYPVGRLDKDSRGLILLTNDGDLTDKLLKSKNGHEKEYLVRLSQDLTDEELRTISQGGIRIEEKRRTKPCRISRKGKGVYDIILTEGMNRQIRKVCALLGKDVLELKRIRFINILLGDLKEGEYRYLSKEEKDGLYKTIQ